MTIVDDIISNYYRMVFIEGTRLSGKTTLARELRFQLNLRQQQMGGLWQYYCTFKDRKTDKARFLDAQLDIGQATLFIMDLVRQHSHLHLICDRSTLSSYVYSRLAERYSDCSWILPTEAGRVLQSRLGLFRAMLEEVNGCVVRLHTPVAALHARARGNQRADEIPTFEDELRFFDEAFEVAELPPERVYMILGVES